LTPDICDLYWHGPANYFHPVTDRTNGGRQEAVQLTRGVEKIANYRRVKGASDQLK
jgi:hypothetical protein